MRLSLLPLLGVFLLPAVAQAADQARAPRLRQERATPANEPATREPVQRWPNWVFKLLHK